MDIPTRKFTDSEDFEQPAAKQASIVSTWSESPFIAYLRLKTILNILLVCTPRALPSGRLRVFFNARLEGLAGSLSVSTMLSSFSRRSL